MGTDLYSEHLGPRMEVGDRQKLLDETDRKATGARVRFVRLAVAFAVSLKCHMRCACEGYAFGTVDSHVMRCALDTPGRLGGAQRESGRCREFLARLRLCLGSVRAFAVEFRVWTPA